MKQLAGLWKEDLKSKRWMIAAVWYVFGMFCLLFSIKMTIPAGEVRSLYVGAGNTSFFAAMILFGILMGAGGFRYLYSEQKADLYFSLPFSRKQLFAVGYLNNFLIFSISAVVCKMLFFRLSLSMGYSQYTDSAPGMRAGCLVLILGFMFVMNLSMLASFLAQNAGYRGGLLALFFFGPDAALHLTEKMFRIFIPSFYRSGTLETLRGYLSPFSLLKNTAGIEEYADGSFWTLDSHLSYLLCLAAFTIVLLLVNLLVFQLRPVERKSRRFLFWPVEWLVRYSCMILAVLWLVDALQIFSFGIFSAVFVVIGVLFGVPLMHGLMNMVIAFDAGRFVSAKRHLLAELFVVSLLIAVFAFWGKQEEKLPPKDAVNSMAVALTALHSGDDSDQALLHMRLTGKEMEAAYDWISADSSKEAADYEILVKYELENGRERYCRYQIPWQGLYGFEEIFAGEEFKKGTYGAFRLDSLKYYDVKWSNGIESYTLDLNEEERQELLEAYREDFGSLTFLELRLLTPVGRLTFASTKNQEDVGGYLYPGFWQTLNLLETYGIDGTKCIGDYEIIKIVVDKYGMTQGLLYHWNFLEWEKTLTDRTVTGELARALYCEEFCEDFLLNEKNLDMEFTVYYRDVRGRTVNSVKCRAQADPKGNAALKELLSDKRSGKRNGLLS